MDDETISQTKELSSEKTWPSVGIAYDFVIPSYGWIVTRFEAVDSRIQTLQAFIATVTLGIPTISTPIFGKMALMSYWFIGAMVLGVLAIVLGLIGRSWGTLTLANPKTLYEQWLHLSPWEFKKDMVFFAGQHFEKSSNFINQKSRLVTVMSILFFAETLSLFMWVMCARS